jgi:import receptor subunit TOM70
MINHALALYTWKQDFASAEKLCRQAITIDPQCDVGVATLAQLLQQQSKVQEAMIMWRKSAEMAVSFHRSLILSIPSSCRPTIRFAQ